MMLAVMLVVVLIGFTLMAAWPSKPTKVRRTRQQETKFMLEELRRSLNMALIDEAKKPNDQRVITALIYGAHRIGYTYDYKTDFYQVVDGDGKAVDVQNDLWKARRDAMYQYLEDRYGEHGSVGDFGGYECMITARSSTTEIEMVLIRELKDRGYLRTSYRVPLLDGYVEDGAGGPMRRVKVAWRIAENLLTSSSFEEEGEGMLNTMERLDDFENYRQYWFSKGGDYDLAHATTTVEPPPYNDFPGQETLTWRELSTAENTLKKQTKVTPGKYGGRVLTLTLPSTTP